MTSPSQPTSPEVDGETPRTKVIRLLWEKQFEGSPWQSKFHLIRPDSLEADYGSLADKIIAALSRSEAPVAGERSKLADDLDARSKWLADRSRVHDAILMQRSAKALRAAGIRALTGKDGA